MELTQDSQCVCVCVCVRSHFGLSLARGAPMAPVGARCVVCSKSVFAPVCGRATLSFDVGTSSPPVGSVSGSLAPRARSAAATCSSSTDAKGAAEKDLAKLMD